MPRRGGGTETQQPGRQRRCGCDLRIRRHSQLL